MISITPEYGCTDWDSPHRMLILLLNLANFLNMLDDCTLQLYRYNGSEGDYGSYLDPESTIDEQSEDFEDFHNKPSGMSAGKRGGSAPFLLTTESFVFLQSLIYKRYTARSRSDLKNASMLIERG
ncbi:hypothetical protein CEXT_335231 [Caerostris extrusa]|uniref:FHOD1 N-terminal GTPase-binding domain-containing protein n=1 Tax=Caerostris extrusa TaxID=172846 RepID=A0AAV4NRE5_CAEEX|nr:hypothetical protein CEXT_335231 [Caerostris extrusa]